MVVDGSDSKWKKMKKSFEAELRGLGGKTQVALEFCRQPRARGFQAIFWIDASLESAVKQSFQAVVGRVKNSSVTIADEVAVAFVLEEFRDWEERG